jgi:hypothetical protein
MANFSRLHDLYSFPGFTPAATVRGVAGDPYAVVISLRRRRKKLTVACAGSAINPSTISHGERHATSIVVAAASTWSFPFAASSVASAKL